MSTREDATREDQPHASILTNPPASAAPDVPRSGRPRKGCKWLGIALEEAALAAIRSKNTYLAAQYQRLKPRIGHGRALGAVKHSILIAYWHMFTNGETYNDPGGDYFQRRDPTRATKRLVAKLEALGHHITLQPAT
ncbi:MAG: hypothetical protein ACYC91_16190 [Solirubrobacteraceae bacterium]